MPAEKVQLSLFCLLLLLWAFFIFPVNGRRMFSYSSSSNNSLALKTQVCLLNFYLSFMPQFVMGAAEKLDGVWSCIHAWFS